MTWNEAPESGNHEAEVEGTKFATKALGAWEKLETFIDCIGGLVQTF